jgi:hypothetical protein
MSNVMKIPPVETELFHAARRTNGQTDEQTDMTKLIVAFRNSANAAKRLQLTIITTSVPILVTPRACNHTTVHLPLRLGIPTIRISF